MWRVVEKVARFILTSFRFYAKTCRQTVFHKVISKIFDLLVGSKAQRRTRKFSEPDNDSE